MNPAPQDALNGPPAPRAAAGKEGRFIPPGSWFKPSV
jgi:hypothetical protein